MDHCVDLSFIVFSKYKTQLSPSKVNEVESISYTSNIGVPRE